jgi:hypothetical protein
MRCRSRLRLPLTVHASQQRGDHIAALRALSSAYRALCRLTLSSNTMAPRVRVVATLLILASACEGQSTVRVAPPQAETGAKADARQPGLFVSPARVAARANDVDRARIFMDVENVTSDTIVIRGVQCDGVASARLEGSVRGYVPSRDRSTGGEGVKHVFTTEQLASVTVSSGQWMQFAPMEREIALAGVERPLTAGRVVSCRLDTTKGVVTFNATVQ